VSRTRLRRQVGIGVETETGLELEAGPGEGGVREAEQEGGDEDGMGWDRWWPTPPQRVDDHFELDSAPGCGLFSLSSSFPCPPWRLIQSHPFLFMSFSSLGQGCQLLQVHI
jgi:hypothetical protein